MSFPRSSRDSTYLPFPGEIQWAFEHRFQATLETPNGSPAVISIRRVARSQGLGARGLGELAEFGEPSELRVGGHVSGGWDSARSANPMAPVPAPVPHGTNASASVRIRYDASCSASASASTMPVQIRGKRGIIWNRHIHKYWT